MKHKNILVDFLISNKAFMTGILEDLECVQSETTNEELRNEIGQMILFRRIGNILYDQELDRMGASEEIINEYYRNWQRWIDVQKMCIEVNDAIEQM